MVYKHFRIICLVRILFIALSIALLVFLLMRTELYATSLIVTLAVIFQIWALFRYVEETNRKLSRFLLSIRYSDFAQSFSSTTKGKSFDELNLAFNEVIREFQKARMEKEEHYRYLQTVVQHINVGLIVYDLNGKVDLFNSAAKRLLKLPYLKSIAELNSINSELTEKLLSIQPGERLQVKLEDEQDTRILWINAADFILRQQRYKLVSLQNIQSELDEKEMESWQKLIRTLTHEIMNSITPIASLATTTHDLLQKPETISDQESLDDIVAAVKTIEKRSVGLIDFVNSYRELTRIPRPRYESILAGELLNRVVQLLDEKVKAAGILFSIEVDPESLELTIDPGLIEQVLINLCYNAIDAVKDVEKPQISMSASIDGKSRNVITVSDNGFGMEAHLLDKIFIPFFTTKKSGTGIGLSLSRQIMRLHHGTIRVRSTPGEGTAFTIRF